MFAKADRVQVGCRLVGFLKHILTSDHLIKLNKVRRVSSFSLQGLRRTVQRVAGKRLDSSLAILDG